MISKANWIIHTHRHTHTHTHPHTPTHTPTHPHTYLISRLRWPEDGHVLIISASIATQGSLSTTATSSMSSSSGLHYGTERISGTEQWISGTD